MNTNKFDAIKQILGLYKEGARRGEKEIWKGDRQGKRARMEVGEGEREMKERVWGPGGGGGEKMD